MVSLPLAASIFAGVITCDSVLEKSSTEALWQSEDVPAKIWPEALCDKHKGSVDELAFHVITEQHSNRGRSYEGDKGRLSISEINAGRVRISWQSQIGGEGFTVWMKVAAKESTWIAARSIPAGSIISDRDITFTSAEIGPWLGKEGILSDDPVGKMTLRGLRRNEVITSESISERPLIMKNDKVKVVVHSGSLRITSPAKALSTGWKKGDSVSILVENSESPTYGKVIGEGHVYIEI